MMVSYYWVIVSYCRSRRFVITRVYIQIFMREGTVREGDHIFMREGDHIFMREGHYEGGRPYLYEGGRPYL